EALRRAYPKAHFTWLVEEAASDIVIDHPLLDRVLISRRKTWIRNIKKGRLRSTLKDIRLFLKDLRSVRYDLVIDLQGLFKSGILAFLSGGRQRLGFDRSRELSYLFYNKRMSPYDRDRHALLRYLDVASLLGAEVRKDVEFRLPHCEEAARQAQQLLADTGRPQVVINPMARWETKLWPVRSWKELIQRLTRELQIRVVLTGGPQDKALCREIAQQDLGTLDVTGKTSLKVLLEIFRSADLVVCPDTGPMHLAAGTGTPVVALFGPTAPWRTGPYGPDHLVLRRELECSPCFRRKCPEPRCMADLSVDQVFDAVRSKLEGKNYS
ncbi:MAG: glycosyltransferase family 9 protein, partial [Deltaproteobacteria bacterium]|nr:glycosyltransferase family 9 protein [Deltaproteobacteria bacterium]